MRVLHLISDWKWTGPAEPVVSLCEALLKEEIDVRIAYRKTPIDFPERTIEKEVKRRGIPFYEGFRLNRYFSLKDWLQDIVKIGAYCERERIDICHTHLSHDHYLAFLSTHFRRRGPLIVRTDHKRDGLKKDVFLTFVVKRTDGIVTYSEKIKRKDAENFGLDENKICVIPPGVKIVTEPVTDVRDQFGLRADERVIGIVGRLKADRGYDLILRAYKTVKEKYPNWKLLIMGRSSQIEKSILRPVKELGISDGVILAGYRTHDYYSVINCFDIFVMMRAGSDGTARALREVMSMGKPAIVSDNGMLPELVKDGETGFVVEENHEILAERMIFLIQNEELRRKMGTNAQEYAIKNWSYENQARVLIQFYQKLLNEKIKNSYSP
ncbi:MAG: glycosyltransferase family 4 protein [Deltaproteobacteria bacterium]|nr:glycosyltransferase family 4 protein [Deltaproteobacteria bacterium]